MFKSIIIIFLLSLSIRIYGLNWDQGYHLHPDERFLTMVSISMNFVGNYFNTDQSLLNPHNLGFDFFVYGTWPTILVRAISGLLLSVTYDKLTLIGRFVSALFDSGTCVLVYLIGLVLFKNKKSAFLSAFSYSFSILPIQLAHFYAVDTFLVFCLTLSLYFLVSNTNAFWLGLSFGLAVSAKITAILFIPIILIKLIFTRDNLKNKIKSILVFLISSLLFIRIFYPYLFNGLSLNTKVLQNWTTLKSFDLPGYFPPAVQWINYSSLSLYLNTIFYGLGLPLGIAFIFTFVFLPKVFKKYPQTYLLYIWVIGLLLYYGFQFAKPLRYLYPAYPAICLLSGLLVSKLNLKIVVIFAFITSLWLYSFLSIYSNPHSRVTASSWIHQNIPPGSKISCEYWDDCLPLFGSEKYHIIQIYPYDKSSLPNINDFDYLVFSSNRLFGGIPSAPNLYYKTSNFYKDLFDEKLGFKKVAEFTSRPNIYLPYIRYCLVPPFFNYGFVSKQGQWCTKNGLILVDDYAEESFTVYDHPKIIIFKKISH